MEKFRLLFGLLTPFYAVEEVPRTYLTQPDEMFL